MTPLKYTTLGLFLLSLITVLVIWREPILERTGGGERVAAKISKPSPARVQTPSTKESPASTTLKKLFEGGEPPKLTAEQMKAFVEKQKHSSASLLAAWQLGQDNAWLEEAARLHPDDPRVALAKLGSMKALDADAEEWITRLTKNDPNNAIGWCYEAMSAFKAGTPDAARTALAAAAKLERFDGYPKESSASLADAYRSSGMDGLSAQVLGMSGVLLPQAGLAMNLQKEVLKQFGSNLDDSLIQDMLSLSKNVRKSNGSGYLLTDLVAASMERKMLSELSALELVPGTKKFVTERLAELDVEKSTVKDLVGQANQLLPELNDSELKQYMRRIEVEGELKAMQWLLSQPPAQK